MKFSKPPNSCPRRGFTLLETAMAQVIIGVAITAMCQLLATGTKSNQAATELSTGVNLANNIHEIAVGLPYADGGGPVEGSYHDIWNLDGQTFTPPVDANLSPISTYPNWTQTISVQTVDSNNVGNVLPSNQALPTARVTVTITHAGHFVYTTSWLALAADPS
ncbi:MAG TPA: hypothetical protein VFC78_21060 [Tepidisphaeraceae bacterium]|nr:hypothetical protein [Tepidisphaeraceae bacterium]